MSDYQDLDLTYAIIDIYQNRGLTRVGFDSEQEAIMAIVPHILTHPHTARRLRVIGCDANGREIVRLRPRLSPNWRR